MPPLGTPAIHGGEHVRFKLWQISADSHTAGGTRAFRRLLQYLGQPEEGWDPECVVSLGDVAVSNGAADAWSSMQFLDWSSIATRRMIIGALLPLLRRVQVPADAVSRLGRWCSGEECNLEQLCNESWVLQLVTDLALKAQSWGPVYAADTVLAIALEAQDCAAIRADETGDSPLAAEKAVAAEVAAQAADLIAAFPPLHAAVSSKSDCITEEAPNG
jgi:hypothetical protein